MKLLYAVPLLALVLSGCVVRTYPLTRDRIDQGLESGNRGYFAGAAPAESTDRKTTRTTQIVEIEMRPPITFEKAPAETQFKPQRQEAPVTTEDREIWGNRGYITQSESPEMIQKQTPETGFQSYTVEKNDTLQKISKKFYGTTKKWTKIFDANKDVLKAPNKIYPGQVIKIPNLPAEDQKMLEPKENLK